jgi:hypothetical protein
VDDDDSVLRSLGDDLERDDPALAALLSGADDGRHHRHPARWLLLCAAFALLAAMLPVTVTVGLTALALVLAAPVVACRWASAVDDLRPRHP